MPIVAFVNPNDLAGRLILTRCYPSYASAVRKFDQAFCLAADYFTFADRGGVAIILASAKMATLDAVTRSSSTRFARLRRSDQKAKPAPTPVSMAAAITGKIEVVPQAMHEAILRV
jgi:hypothetical protein